ncbi:MAG: hypothetical protein LBE21_08555, partial [Pseudomonadales bacterium]|nr:hypothetical protein [Pseudomonadales bacterium]
MAKKLLLTTLVLLGGIALLLGATWYWREPLLKLAANHTLAETGVTITTLRGSRLSRTRAALDELILTLSSGQELALGNIELNFALRSLRDVPTLGALDIVSLRLSGETVSTPETPADDASLLLSEILTQLRDFPLP